MRGAAVLLVLALTALPLFAQAPPAIVVEAPAELANARARIEAYDLRPLSAIVRLTGSKDPGPPMRVVLADTHGDLARGVPSFVAGYAVGEEGLIVLFPARTPDYPHDTLEDVLRHEVAHVLISRAAAGQDVPRWFHEGFAVAVERPWALEDRTRLASALVFGPRLNIGAVDALFAGGQAAQATAYALSAAIVRHLMAAYGEDAPARVLREVAAGRSFDDALVTVTAQPLPRFEDGFWNAQRTWTTWVPLLASTTILWIVVIALGAVALRRIRQRSLRLRSAWAAEEALAAARDAPDAAEPMEPDNRR